jgi:putative flavoprotein involved in K+ transport
VTRTAEILEAAVIGAGWAGLGVSAALIGAGIRHRVLERGRIGETWRTQRWESFRMNTPNSRSVMPGDTYRGPDPDGFLTRDEFVEVLADFAERKRLPVELHTPVTELVQDSEGVFRLSTPRRTLRVRNVVIASGSLNRPRRPVWSGALPPGLLQIDACDYRSPAALPSGSILVVGSGQSGGQIAEDLVGAGRRVFLATGDVGRFPRRYRGQDITTWLLQSGFMDVPRKELIDASGRIAGRPLLGAVHTISLQSLSAQGVVLLGRFTGINGYGLSFADDLEEHIRLADETSADIKCRIDDYIRGAGIHAPPAEADPAETTPPCLPATPIHTLDAAACGITTVIWCTGFEGDFGWVRVPGVLDAKGQPIHEDGLAAVTGIYFAGLDFASTRKSGTILAIAEEAAHLVQRIAPSGRNASDDERPAVRQRSRS